MTHVDPIAGAPRGPKKKRKSRRLETWRRKAERHNVSTRTLDRWVIDGIIDPPFKINGRKFADANEEPRHDAAAADSAP